MRAQGKLEVGLHAGDRDGAAAMTKQTKGDGDVAWEKYGNNRATAPAQVASGMARGGRGDAVRGQCRGAAESMSGAVAPTAIVVTACLSGGGASG